MGFNQADFAAIAGVAKTSQFNYEKGDRSPDADYLAAVAERGVDILYVVVGQRLPVTEPTLSSDEVEMVEQVRALDDDDKGAVKRLLRAFNRKQ